MTYSLFKKLKPPFSMGMVITLFVFVGAIFLTLLLKPMPTWAAVVDCQASRSGASNVLYLYYPTSQDNNFPTELSGTTTGPVPAFTVSNLDPNIGTTAQIRNAISERVRLDYCEFDVQVVQATSSNGTTNPTPNDDRWQVVAIGGDAFDSRVLYGIAQDVDIGDMDEMDFGRVWADEFGQESESGGAIEGTLVGANSTLERWANAIAGTTSHEAGHNYGLGHRDSESRPSEDERQNHLMASSATSTGGLTGEDRAEDRHFSDTSFEILAGNIGLYEQTVSNWDFINPNTSTADGFSITVLVAQDAGTPSVGSVYTGGLSPWNNVDLSANGTDIFRGTEYDRYEITFIDPKNWNNGDPGEIEPGVEFHVGVGLTTNYIVRNVTLFAGDSPLELNPRVIGYTPDGSFDPATGDYHLTLSVPDPENGPLMISDVRIRHIPRTIDINEMVNNGILRGIDGRTIVPWNTRFGDSPFEFTNEATLGVANLAEPRAVDFMLTPEPGCVPGLPDIPPVEDGGIFEVNYCPEGRVLGLFPSARVYVEATVTDPNARFFDRDAGEMVTGPLSERIFIQFPGAKPDLNDNGVDDAIDIDNGTCTDTNENGVCDDAEPDRFKYAAKLVCGKQEDIDNTRLVRGFYGTAINIFNPGSETARFTKRLALSYPPEEQMAGKTFLIAEDRLPPDHALEVDCIDIEQRLFPNGLPESYIKGFVVIESDHSLDVTGVYTSRSLPVVHHSDSCGDDSCQEQHCSNYKDKHHSSKCASSDSESVSIDVEQIRERVIKSKEPPVELCPDLAVLDIGRPQVRCPQGGGSCQTKVEILIGNLGNAASGAFDLRTTFDPQASVVVNQQVSQGLMPGEQQTIVVTTPPGGNCFDPNCSISVVVDPNNRIQECREDNNTGMETTQG